MPYLLGSSDDDSREQLLELKKYKSFYSPINGAIFYTVYTGKTSVICRYKQLYIIYSKNL